MSNESPLTSPKASNSQLTPSQPASGKKLAKSKKIASQKKFSTVSDVNPDSAIGGGGSKAGTPPCVCRKTRRVWTTQAIETHEYEITIGRQYGTTNYVFNGPIMLAPDTSMDVLLQRIHTHYGIPIEDLKLSLKNCKDDTQAINSQGKKFSNLGHDPEIQTGQTLEGHGGSSTGLSPPRIQIEGDESGDTCEMPTVISSGLDEEGNMKISLRLAKTISTKAIRVRRESSQIMAKACYMTIFCSAFIIFIWIVLNHTGNTWVARSQQGLTTPSPLTEFSNSTN
eukprot:maker-scaffold730_size105374-snap-gene-0.19 protein:Tk06143 transcript:maker-scaffold730_size105374-snap-gene-0.19-mRNA-1 annotation:"archaeal flagella assembly protein j"